MLPHNTQSGRNSAPKRYFDRFFQSVDTRTGWHAMLILGLPSICRLSKQACTDEDVLNQVAETAIILIFTQNKQIRFSPGSIQERLCGQLENNVTLSPASISSCFLLIKTNKPKKSSVVVLLENGYLVPPGSDTMFFQGEY